MPFKLNAIIWRDIVITNGLGCTNSSVWMKETFNTQNKWFLTAHLTNWLQSWYHYPLKEILLCHCSCFLCYFIFQLASVPFWPFFFLSFYFLLFYFAQLQNKNGNVKRNSFERVVMDDVLTIRTFFFLFLVLFWEEPCNLLNYWCCSFWKWN